MTEQKRSTILGSVLGAPAQTKSWFCFWFSFKTNQQKDSPHGACRGSIKAASKRNTSGGSRPTPAFLPINNPLYQHPPRVAHWYPKWLVQMDRPWRVLVVSFIRESPNGIHSQHPERSLPTYRTDWKLSPTPRSMRTSRPLSTTQRHFRAHMWKDSWRLLKRTLMIFKPYPLLWTCRKYTKKRGFLKLWGGFFL